MVDNEEKQFIYTDDLKVKNNKKDAIKKTIISIFIILLFAAITLAITFAILYVKNK